MPYIEAPKPETGEHNPFASIPEEKDDRKVHIVLRSSHSYVVMNKFPYNAGHLLVVPYREVDRLDALTAAEKTDFFDTIIEAQHILERALSPDGFNVGFNFGRAAGAGIPTHLHCHLVPRWSGDTNFMPVLGETRVLPEAMDAMWQRLRQCIDASST
ncbi:MAG: HIT domain-containing protein [Verrucomicrobiota bacterium]